MLSKRQTPLSDVWITDWEERRPFTTGSLSGRMIELSKQKRKSRTREKHQYGETDQARSEESMIKIERDVMGDSYNRRGSRRWCHEVTGRKIEDQNSVMIDMKAILAEVGVVGQRTPRPKTPILVPFISVLIFG